MPIYQYKCDCWEHVFEKFLPVSQHQAWHVCDCGSAAHQIITAPLMVKAQQECRYTSPVDGTPITSWAARRNDLAKHNCQPYEEGMKQDYNRRLVDGDQALDKAVDEHVESAFSKMTHKQRQKLNAEVTEMGMTAEYARGTK